MPDSRRGWAALGACAVQVHSGWALPAWIAEQAGARLREAGAAGQALPSRELEFTLDAAARKRRIAGHGAWTSPEWQELQQLQAARPVENDLDNILERMDLADGGDLSR